jgi:uncharacterized protein (TIGR02611 family)
MVGVVAIALISGAMWRALVERRNMFDGSKQSYRVFKEADEGKRFLALYEHRERKRRGAIPIGKLLNIGIGAVVIVVGVILTPIPGPGLTVITIGAAIMGTEFRLTARLFDRAEVKLHRGWHAVKKRWMPLSTPMKILLLVIILVLATAIAIASTKLMVDVVEEVVD